MCFYRAPDPKAEDARIPAEDLPRCVCVFEVFHIFVRFQTKMDSIHFCLIDLLTILHTDKAKIGFWSVLLIY